MQSSQYHTQWNVWARSGSCCMKFAPWIERFLLQSTLLTACSLRDRSLLHVKFWYCGSSDFGLYVPSGSTGVVF